MKVVHVVHAFDTGGMEKGVATIIRHGSPDLQHVVVCLTQSGASEKLLPPGTEVLALGKRPDHSWSFLLRLSRTLKRLRPDVVHTRNWGGLDGVIACRMAGLRPVVHGEHGWTMDDPFGRMPRRVHVRRFLSRWIREYTCVSREMLQWLDSTVRVRVPVTQVYNGVDTDLYSPALTPGAIRQELGIPAGAFVTTVCGRLDPIKDHPTLFRAFAAVREEVAEAWLLVVGDGPERQRLEQQAGEHVLFLGNRPDVPQILRDTDVFVLASRNEGISNTILEAMATGLPVVATRVGGNPELVEEGTTGVLVGPGDPEAIRRALLDYRRDPRKAAAHGAAGRQRVLGEFGIRNMLEAYEAVYRRVAGVAASGDSAA